MAKLTDAEVAEITEQAQAERLASVKQFFTGVLKAVTTDLPGFLMDVADKMAGDTSTLGGEKDRSSQIFEAMTGIKSTGSVDEMVGGVVNPIGLGKAIIIPAMLGKASKAKTLEAMGTSIEDIYAQTGVFRDIKTGSFKQVIPDTGAKFKPGALTPPTHGYMSAWDESRNPTRASSLTTDIFTDTYLKDVLDHPELLKTNMLGVGDVKVNKLLMSPNVLGSYDPARDTIRLSGNADPNNLLSTLLHETQHSVQMRVGTQGGGNTSMFFDSPETFQKKLSESRKLINTLESEFNAVFKGSAGLEIYSDPAYSLTRLKRDAMNTHYPALAEAAKKELGQLPVATLKAHQQIQEAAEAADVLRKADSEAFTNYKRLLGETEARLVQTQHRNNDYLTHPYQLMADDLGVSIQDLAKTIIGDVSEVTPLDKTIDVDEAMKLVDQLMQSRSTKP